MPSDKQVKEQEDKLFALLEVRNGKLDIALCSGNTVFRSVMERLKNSEPGASDIVNKFALKGEVGLLLSYAKHHNFAVVRIK